MTFTEILDHLSIPYRRHGEHHHTTSGWVNLDCPFCSPGWNHYRLGYNLRRGDLSCWQCGRLDAYKVLTEITGQTYRQLKPLLGNLSRDVLPPEIEKRGKLVLPSKLGPLTKFHKKFLERRKLDVDQIVETWKIQGTSGTSELPWRLFIPIHFRDEVVSWTTRSIKDKAEQRYLAARPEQEKYNHHDLLYGEHLAKNAVVVVEGPTDVWRIGPGAVATFGTAYRRSQVARLSRFPVRAIWYDAGSIAQRKAEKLVADLEVFPGRTFLISGSTKDPGSASRADLKRVRKILD